MQIEIEFDYDVFLPKYRHLVDSDADIFVLWGGRDSGKSHFIAQKLVKDCLEEEYFKCILTRKVQDTIKESQWATIKEVIEDWRLQHLFDFTTHPLEIRCINGNKFIARGADKSGKVKGVKDPSHAWFEELNQMTKDEYSVVSTTLRSSKTKVREYWSFNPECDGNYEDFWLYKVVGDNYSSHSEVKEINEGGTKFFVKYEFVHSTYEDNPYCPPERKAKYLNTTIGDDYLYGVWIRGMWGNQKVTRPFAYAYDEKKHVRAVERMQGAQVIVVVDFNLDPFCANLFQMYRRDGQIRCEQFQEITIPGGSVPEMADRIVDAVGADLYTMQLTGDASGAKRSIERRDKLSLFGQLRDAMKIHDRQIIVRSNPLHTTSRNDVNYFLQHFPGFVISETCTNTRRDMRTVQVDATGSIIKRNRNDVSQQADHIDNIRYLVNAFFADAIKKHRKFGKW
jgi:hypothetical protein